MTTNTVLLRNYFVYAFFREDGFTPFYIGITCRKKRPGQHLTDARGGKRSHKCDIIREMLARAIPVVPVIIADGLTKPEAAQIEIDLIALIGRYPRGPLANISPGGGLGPNIPLEVRQRIARDLGNRRRGIPLSQEWRANIGAAGRGRKRPPEVSEKIAAQHRGRRRSPETRALLREAWKTRPPHSAESNAKRSETLRGRLVSPETKAKIGASNTRRWERWRAAKEVANTE